MTDLSILPAADGVPTISKQTRVESLVTRALELPLRTAVMECSRWHVKASLAAFKWAMDVVKADPILRVHSRAWTQIDAALSAVHRAPYKRSISHVEERPSDVFYSASIGALAIQCCTEALVLEDDPVERSHLFRRRAEMYACGKSVAQLESGDQKDDDVVLACEDQKSMFSALGRDVPMDCSVCLETLDIGTRYRAVLPCFHALCAGCHLQVMKAGMYAKPKPRAPTCPECRAKFTA